MRTGEKILLVGLLALALGLGFYTALGPISGKQAKLESDLKRLQEENIRLADENHQLLLQVNALRNRKDYQEKVIRDELGLVKPDEVLIQLPAKKNKTLEKPSKATADGGR